jgi:hypothetical protein
MSPRFSKAFVLTIVLPAVVSLLGTSAQAQQSLARPSGSTPPGVLKLTPGLTQQQLVGLPDGQMIQLSDGRSVRLGDVRRLRARMEALHTQVDRTPAAFKLKPAATGKPITSTADLASALRTMRDSDTLRLPSGRLVTVAQIKLLQPILEQRLGMRLDQVPIPVNLSGPAIKLTANMSKAELERRLPHQLADEAILESPHGMRATAGQVRQYLAATSVPPVKGARRTVVPGRRTLMPIPQAQARRPQ